MNENKRILSIGIDPYLIDFTSPEYAAFPGLTADKVAAGINGSINSLKELGYDAEKCWIDFGETAEAVVSEKIQSNDYAAILIGAGIRVPEKNLILFEKLINLIHKSCPHTKIVFNKTPHDVLEAVQRWV